MKKQKTRKESLMEIKDLAMKGVQRGILAIIVVVLGFITLIITSFLGKEIVSVVAPSVFALLVLVLEWYYQRKTEDE